MIEIISSLLTIITAMLGITIVFLRKDMDSIFVKTQHKDFIIDIVNQKNKNLKLTLLKIYLGTSIDHAIAKYVFKSPYFYEIIHSLKNTHYEICVNDQTGYLDYKNNKKPNRVGLTIAYFIFLIPLIVFISITNKIFTYKNICISLILLTVICTYISINCAIEIYRRTSIIRIVELSKKNQS